MSLEALLTKLTASLDRNSEALEALNTKAGGTKPAADKPAAGKPAAGKPAAGKPAAGRKPKAVTAEDVAEAVGAYLADADDDADRKERKAKVRAVLDYFGAERVSAMDAAHFEEAMTYMKQLQAGETPSFDGGDGGDGGEEEDDSIM